MGAPAIRQPLAVRRWRSWKRPVPARVRRSRAVAAVLALLVAAVAAWFAAGPGGGAGTGGKALLPGRAAVAARGLPAAEACCPGICLIPVSREVAVAGSPGQLLVAGGLMASGASANAVYAVPGPGVTRPATATSAGSLPAPRSDAAAVTIGSTTYLVGGYDGTRPDVPVLATTDGRAFTTVTALPVPVRYPAVAALSGQIYVFGGQAITGSQAGAPVNVIQAVDPARRTAAVIGDLPAPLAGAAAMTVDGELFVAGGESPAAQRPAPGLGTTQLGPGESGTGARAEGSSPSASTVSTIWAFDPASRRLLAAGRLQVPASHAAAVVAGSAAWIIGGESGGKLVSSVQMLRPDRAFGTAGAPGAGSPYFGSRLLVADRGNNRLLLMDAQMHLIWQYPPRSSPRHGPRLYFPDDAFFTGHGTAIISNQEQNETIIEIAYPSGKIIWSYGHPRQAGTAAGYLSEPDDAYLLKNGQITVADASNCRVLVINANRTVAHQIGATGICAHHPPASMGSPNGDTPLPDGNLLVSEITGSWVSEYTMSGTLAWTVHLPISYPSDPQQLGPDRYLIPADYAAPGQIIEFNRHSQILYRYHPAAGPGMLGHPSLTELLPSRVFTVNDDYNHRMAAIDPATGALVWQYGITGKPGTAPGELNTPDGLDLLQPDGSTPTHPTTG